VSYKVVTVTPTFGVCPVAALSLQFWSEVHSIVFAVLVAIHQCAHHITVPLAGAVAVHKPSTRLSIKVYKHPWILVPIFMMTLLVHLILDSFRYLPIAQFWFLVQKVYPEMG